MYLKLFSYGLVGVLSFAGSWGIQANRYERQLSDLKTEYTEAKNKAIEEVHAQVISLQQAKDDAEKKSSIRLAAYRRDASKARDALIRLRDSSQAAISREAPGTTSFDNATALAWVLGKCAGELTDLAATADGHVNDIKTLMDAWPKNR